MATVAQRISILLTLAGASLRSEFQYRANAVSAVISGMIYQLTGFIAVWIIVARFNEIGGWSLAEITFLYGMRLTSHGIFYACFSQLFEADRVMVTGEYDRYLLRPMPPLLQLFTRKLRVNCFGDLIGGLLLLGFASAGVDVAWSPQTVFYLVLAVTGGALVEGAVQIMLGSLSFRFLQTMSLRVTVNEVFNLYGNYPFTIFPKALEYLLTFALPVAFVAFFPASVVLEREDGLHVAPWLAVIAPLVGVGLFLVALRVWRRQSRHYQSSGH
ncbi:MAG TPA: ABC-2 family transporter protein [Thermomicrobiales bacterium]|nr:ABC-2 family transporter protein [Thermomicrobiales bacterium]